jgi:LysM repeat protein
MWLGCLIVAAASAELLVAGCSSPHGGNTLPAATTRTTRTTFVRVATTTTVPFITYHVRKGDTLTRLANHYRVPTSSIMRLNHITNPDVLTEGQLLRIPPAPPLKLAITPTTGSQGQAFQLTLTGAPPSEAVTFEVHSPRATFTGPPHIATADGTLTATYQTGTGDPPGTFTVVAKRGTRPISQATFVLRASTPST